MKADVLKSPVIEMIAKEIGKSPAQTALRWGLQMGHSILPKSTNEGRIRENFDVLGWSIPKEMFDKFSKIEQVSETINHISANFVSVSSLNCNLLYFGF